MSTPIENVSVVVMQKASHLLPNCKNLLIQHTHCQIYPLTKSCQVIPWFTTQAWKVLHFHFKNKVFNCFTSMQRNTRFAALHKWNEMILTTSCIETIKLSQTLKTTYVISFPKGLSEKTSTFTWLLVISLVWCFFCSSIMGEGCYEFGDKTCSTCKQGANDR